MCFLCVHTWVHTKCEWIKWEQSVNNIAFTKLPLQCKQYLLHISSPKLHNCAKNTFLDIFWDRPSPASHILQTTNTQLSCNTQSMGECCMFDLICQCETFTDVSFWKPGKCWIMKKCKQYLVNVTSPNIPNYKMGQKININQISKMKTCTPRPSEEP